MELRDDIVTIVNYFLTNKMTKEDIYNWSIMKIHEMLKGEVLKLNNLGYWGILVELSGIGELDDKSADEIIIQLNNLILGKRDASFCWEMQIPEKFVENDLSWLYDIILKYRTCSQLLEADILHLKSALAQRTNPIITLNEMIKTQIFDLLEAGYNLCLEETEMSFSLKHTIFIISEEVLEENYLDKILQLLECYRGKRAFSIQVRFESGSRNLSIQV